MTRRGTPQVLFAGHEATRTGAPLMFLYFLRWLRDNTDLEFEILLLEGGPLMDEFRAVAPTRVLSDLQDGRVSRWLVRLGLGRPAALWRSAMARWWCRHLRPIPALYCNSVTSIRVVSLLGRKPRLVVSHIHELEGAIGLEAMQSDRDLLHAHVDWFVAASELVKRNLVDNHEFDPDRIVVHYEFIDVPAFLAQAPAQGADPRRLLDLPEDAFVVGAVGVTELRKGPDLFLSLAMVLGGRDLGRPVHFVWVGADPASPDTRWLDHERSKAGLEPTVHLVAPQARPAPWFELFDVFSLTSREDPFPLVCLESSLLGVPIVCFDNTGMAEFAGDGDCGFVVRYLDVDAMADRIEALLTDDEARAAVGARAAARVKERHDVGYGAPRLAADLARWRQAGVPAGG